jgi:predicted ArsR family transcriptional regulator
MARSTICHIIKELLKASRGITIQQISENVHSSKENVRDWMYELEYQGLVKTVDTTEINTSTGIKRAYLWRWNGNN